jgi:hypothetical protein
MTTDMSMTDQQIHQLILDAVNRLDETIIFILEKDVNATFNVFEMQSEFIKEVGLPDEAIQYDVQSGRGLVRINVEWSFHHMWQDGVIKKVGPNTYQSLKGDKPPYKSTILSSGIRRYTKVRGEIVVSAKILKRMNWDNQKVFNCLRESKIFQDAPSIVIHQAIDKAEKELAAT